MKTRKKKAPPTGEIVGGAESAAPESNTEPVLEQQQHLEQPQKELELEIFDALVMVELIKRILRRHHTSWDTVESIMDAAANKVEALKGGLP
jgi:hypothetical protein